MNRWMLILSLIVGQIVLLPPLLKIAAVFKFFSLPYGYVGIAAIGLILCVATFTAWFFFKKTDSAIVILSLVCGALLNFCFFITVPVSIDRAISVYFLSQFYAMPENTIDERTARSIIADHYMTDTKAVERRLQEQMITGTIEKIESDKYSKTQNLNYFIKACSFIGNLYAIKDNNCTSALNTNVH